MLLKAIRCAIWLVLCQGATRAPIIAEFQAANTATIRDEDGEAPDWLEVYNPDDTAADLSGMALTDDPAQLRKWIFPAISLPPRATLLIWCSGKNRIQPAAPLHTNFKLGQEGGFLALSDRNGLIGRSVWNPYPPQVEDRSYGVMFPVTSETVIAAAAPCRWRIPVVDIPDWQQVSFDDSTWTPALTGIGYDRVTSDVNFLPLLGAGGNVENVMFGVRSSCLVRIPFHLAKPEDVITLTLHAKYDDGFAAWLNGTRLTPPASATNVPAVVEVGANALAARTNADALALQTFSLTSQTTLLQEGQNVLAIHLLNQSPSSSDVLFLPELVLTKTQSDGLWETGYFAAPTPGLRHNAPPVLGFVRTPVASVGRGFFTAPVTVSFTSETSGAVIRYTTDGSLPGPTSGIVAGGPITLTTSQVLRAAAFLPGWEPSPVINQTYLFPAGIVNQPAAPPDFPSTWGNEYNYFSGQYSGAVVPADYRMDPGVTAADAYAALMIPALTTTLPVVSLSCNTTEIFAGTSGIYGNARQNDELELKAGIEFWNPSNGENWQENAGLRLHGGNAAVDHPKKPFRVYFRRTYGNGRLRQPVFPGSPVTTFDKLQLRPCGHDGWAVPFGSGDGDLARHASYCRDRFLRQTELDMGRLAPRGRYVHLYINALYWGVYDLHEVPGKEMFANHLGGNESEWDVVEHPGKEGRTFDTVDGTDAALSAALALLPPTPQGADPSIYNSLGDFLTYPEFMDYLIVQMWGAQNDWMGPVFLPRPNGGRQDASYFFNKNWQAGRRSRGTAPSGFFWHNWDAEISMGSSLNVDAGMRDATFNHTLIGTQEEEIERRSGNPGPPALFYHALRKSSPRFRLLFADRLQRHFFNGGTMSAPANLTRLQALRDQLDLPLVAESARWGDVNQGDPDIVTFTRDLHWRSEMDWLRDTYLRTRNDILLAQFAAIGLWPTVLSPVFSQHGGVIIPGYQLTITHPNSGAGSCYYTTDGSNPATVEMDAPVPSSSAVLYAAPFSLTRSTMVKARVFQNNLWSPLTETFFPSEFLPIPRTSSSPN